MTHQINLYWYDGEDEWEVSGQIDDSEVSAALTLEGDKEFIADHDDPVIVLEGHRVSVEIEDVEGDIEEVVSAINRGDDVVLSVYAENFNPDRYRAEVEGGEKIDRDYKDGKCNLLFGW